ncbi:L,D-transpeptidase family protein [Sphingomonas sp. CFBP 13733]|nr:L,D-transpeptidase family protein [Sphingomonas sp. CFBP 13733]MBD8641103.1 L,D-transpeptidase family protein [Sphingomonas sp. CFBP 13733]
MPLALLLTNGAAGAQPAQTAPRRAAPPAKPNAAPAAIGGVVISRQAVTDATVRAVYTKAKWRAVWSDADVAALNTALGDRSRHGLDHVAFLPDLPADAAPADIDVARTRVALAYAGALARGRVDPATLHQVYTLPRPSVDLATGLVAAIARHKVDDWLESLAPQDADYRLLSDAYRVFSEKALTAPSGPAPLEAPAQTGAAALIRVGTRDPRVATIVEQLVESGYLLTPGPVAAPTLVQSASTIAGLQPATPSNAPVYTQAIADAMKGLQTDYGIAADGIVGPETLKVLNLGPGDRARALAVALERRRWLERTPPATRIDVNTAASQLRYYRDGVLVDQRKVIVGEPGRETPALSSPIYRLVANPTWTVPKSIQNGEMANVDDAYLQEHNMVLRDGWIVQQPGPSNALGLVKFDMANDQAIYLHDTSAPGLFDRSQRHLSHGCVRVEDAIGFAQMLADDQGVTEAWQTAQASGEMQFVPLPRRIPVRLLYENVYVGDAGKVAFRTDPYGWNDPVAEQLGFERSAARRAEARDIDIGP